MNNFELKKQILISQLLALDINDQSIISKVINATRSNQLYKLFNQYIRSNRIDIIKQIGRDLKKKEFRLLHYNLKEGLIESLISNYLRKSFKNNKSNLKFQKFIKWVINECNKSNHIDISYKLVNFINKTYYTDLTKDLPNFDKSGDLKMQKLLHLIQNNYENRLEIIELIDLMSYFDYYKNSNDRSRRSQYFQNYREFKRFNIKTLNEWKLEEIGNNIFKFLSQNAFAKKIYNELCINSNDITNKVLWAKLNELKDKWANELIEWEFGSNFSDKKEKIDFYGSHLNKSKKTNLKQSSEINQKHNITENRITIHSTKYPVNLNKDDREFIGITFKGFDKIINHINSKSYVKLITQGFNKKRSQKQKSYYIIYEILPNKQIRNSFDKILKNIEELYSKQRNQSNKYLNSFESVNYKFNYQNSAIKTKQFNHYLQKLDLNKVRNNEIFYPLYKSKDIMRYFAVTITKNTFKLKSNITNESTLNFKGNIDFNPINKDLKQLLYQLNYDKNFYVELKDKIYPNLKLVKDITLKHIKTIEIFFKYLTKYLKNKSNFHWINNLTNYFSYLVNITNKNLLYIKTYLVDRQNNYIIKLQNEWDKVKYYRKNSEKFYLKNQIKTKLNDANNNKDKLDKLYSNLLKEFNIIDAYYKNLLKGKIWAIKGSLAKLLYQRIEKYLSKTTFRNIYTTRNKSELIKLCINNMQNEFTHYSDYIECIKTINLKCDNKFDELLNPNKAVGIHYEKLDVNLNLKSLFKVIFKISEKLGFNDISERIYNLCKSNLYFEQSFLI